MFKETTVLDEWLGISTSETETLVQLISAHVESWVSQQMEQDERKGRLLQELDYYKALIRKARKGAVHSRKSFFFGCYCGTVSWLVAA